MQHDFDKAIIDYEVHGEGRPILLLHGWTMDRRVEMADCEAFFATRPGWRRFYPDLPGMGRSIAKPGLACQDDILETMLAFVDQVMPSGRFLLGGTSLGAYLARAVTARRRSRIAGLLLRVPCIVPEDDRRTLPSFQPLIADEALMAALDAEDRTLVGDALLQTPAYLDAQRRKAQGFVQPAIAGTAPIVNEIRADPERYALSFDLAEAEKTFAEPTLIVAGRQDVTTGYRDVWPILESYQRATFAVIDRADHGWPIDGAGLFHALLDDWLARVAERGF